MSDLPDWVKPGAKYRNPRGHLCHIRGVVDDQVVVRTWWPTKRRWNYTCEPTFVFIEPDFADFYKHVSL